MNAIVPTAAPLSYGDLERLADSIAKSGLFGIKTKDQAVALMMIAHAEGRHPALAARDYDIVNGRPTKKAEAMMRDFIQAGGKVEWHKLTDEMADATFTHPQTGSVRIDWDMKRAQTAFGKKDMYSKFPRQMLRSRVVSEGIRTLWPLATSGMYVEEEIGNLPPPHNGPTLDAEAAVPERDYVADSSPGRLNAAPLRATAPSPPPASLRAVAATVTQERKAAPTPKTTAERAWNRLRRTHSILDALEVALREAQSAEEVDWFVCCGEVMQAKEMYTDEQKTKLEGLITKALAKWWHTPPDATDADDGEVEIAGEEKVMAGD